MDDTIYTLHWSPLKKVTPLRAGYLHVLLMSKEGEDQFKKIFHREHITFLRTPKLLLSR